MFDQPYLTLTVINGVLTDCVLDIDEYYDKFILNERVVWKVAPKKKGQFRYAGYGTFDPNYKKASNKGRPLSKVRKQKHVDSLKTCLSFLIKSLDPRRHPDHFYGIKLDTTNGHLNITGITYVDFENRCFDKYVTDCLNIFRDYINAHTGFNSELVINFDHFATLNYKSVLSLHDRILDRDRIGGALKNMLDKYQKTSIISFKKFVRHFVLTGEVNFGILNGYKMIDFRVDLEYLRSKLPDLTPFNEITKCSSPDFVDILRTKYIDLLNHRLYNKLMTHECNWIKYVNPRGTGKGGVTICFNLGFKDGEYLYKKVNIYKKAYNTYCNTYGQMYVLHSFVGKLTEMFPKDFLISNKIVFTLVK